MTLLVRGVGVTTEIDSVHYETGGAAVAPPPALARDRAVVRSLARHVTVCVAPAGFAKSTVVRAALRWSGRAFVVVPLSRGFADAAALYGYLVRALHGADAPATGAFDAVLDALRAFDGHVLVEGFQLARRVPGLSAAILRLVDETDGSAVRWAITSRDAEDLPVASWIAHRQADDVIRDTVLRLRIDECRAAGPRDAADVAYELTGGWPAPFRLALRAAAPLEPYDASAHRRAARESLRDYLRERVLAAFDEASIALLTTLALYDGTPVDAVATVVARPAEVVERVRRTTGFVALDDDARLRVEPMVRDYLLHRLHEQSGLTEALVVAVLRAERVDDVVALLAVAVRHGDREATAAVLAERGLELFDATHVEPVRAALASLPRQAVFEWRLALLDALVTAASGDLERAESAYARALGLAADARARVAVLERYAFGLIAHDRLADRRALRRVVGDLHYTLEHGAGLDERARAVPLALCAAGLALTGRTETANALLERALTNEGGVPDAERAVTQFAAAVTARATGRDARAHAHLGRALRLSESAGRHRVAAYCHSLRWRLMVESRDSADGAHAVLDSMRAAAERARDAFAGGVASMRRYASAVAEGDLALAEHLRRELAASRVYEDLDHDAIAFADALKLASEGAFGRAYETLAPAVTAHEVRDASTRRAALAMFAAAAGARDDALRALADVASERPTLAAVFAATALVVLGQTGRANAEIAKLERARSELGARERVLVDALRAFYVACEIGLAPDGLSALRGAGWGSLALIFEGLRTRSRRTSASPICALTKTELVVLREIALGGTNAAVAARLDRSVNTVNVHVAAILRKLRCGTRHAAIRLAHELGLATGPR